MIRALKPLADMPGVQLVMFVATDGVPIAVPGREAKPEGDPDAVRQLGKEDAFAALATGWLGELGRVVGAMSWNEPRRVVLKAARGTLLMQRVRGAVLLVVLARGLDPGEVRLSMDGAASRIERSANSRASDYSASIEPPGPLPQSNPGTLSLDVERAGKNGKRKNRSGN